MRAPPLAVHARAAAGVEQIEMDVFRFRGRVEADRNRHEAERNRCIAQRSQSHHCLRKGETAFAIPLRSRCRISELDERTHSHVTAPILQAIRRVATVWIHRSGGLYGRPSASFRRWSSSDSA